MKHWLIVGASRGLGLSLARTLCAAGDRVSAIAQRAEAKHAALEAEYGGRLRYLHADVRSERELRAAAESLDTSTRFDVLVYNAAIHLEHERPDIVEAAMDDLLETLDVNAVGAARSVKHFRRFLSDSGLLLFVSSEAGSIGNAGRPSEYGYCMSKAALNMLAKLLSNREQKLGSGVQIVAMHPGWMRTDMGGAQAHLSAEEAAESIVKTLAERPARGAPMFVDRNGQALPW
ncbi:MAG TPA: SDR family NAD(P)-dependent oxidoreductase [Polyangiaceae bacterium]|jgi:NAD(P)-dependent dehydrogenase (short-subunit alcohol dehydrogenase family)|nr:SDR family NAD(P)-dependent oxidoreductase [Polyangiaceae bacterium]